MCLTMIGFSTCVIFINKFKIFREMARNRRKDVLFILLFVIYLLLRIFSASEYFLLQNNDAARYLALADSFPKNALANNQLNILHPPLYAYAIHFFSLFVQDHIAGLLVSVLSSVIMFFILWKFFMLLTNDWNVSFFALILFSISGFYIKMTQSVIKEPFAVMLTISCLYFYLRFLKEEKSKYVLYSAAAGFATGFTTDHSILLIPGIIITYLIFGKFRKSWIVVLPLIAVVASFSMWAGVKIYVYTHNNYYPAGMDGTIVDTSHWDYRQVLSSQYFDEVSQYIPYGISMDPLHYIYPSLYMLNLVVAPYPLGIRINTVSMLFSKTYFVQLFVYTFLIVCAALGLFAVLKGIFVKKKFKNNAMLYSLLLFFVYLSPIMQKFLSTRYLVTSYVFLFLIISFGFFYLLNLLKIKYVANAIIIFLVVVLFIYLQFYIYKNPHFLLTKQEVVEAAKAAQFINTLPQDGFMVQIGYSQQLNYLTNKRILELPSGPDKMMFFVKTYNISYVVYGELNSKPVAQGTRENVFNYDTIKYILKHPEAFRLVKVVEENYPMIKRTDHVYIYKVI